MQTLLVAFLLIAFGGVGAFVARDSERLANRLGFWSCAAGCLLGLFPALHGLIGGTQSALRWDWSVPGGSLSFGVDALSALFLVPVFVLSLLGAIYGIGYRAQEPGRKPAGTHWLFYNILVASMAAVVTARNGLLFLMVWEIMALASFFLVTTHDERRSVRDAGWVYLVATHLGTAFLFGLFVVLGQRSGSLDFDAFSVGGPLSPGMAAAAFLLAVAGFGAKAGFVPFHVWLPEAHPAAPSHVSALMSGVMIKTGLYGLMRTITFLGPPPAWWGWLLLVLGLTCALYGIVFALVQHELKRLLAYSSVENVGIITVGLGVGLLGLSRDLPQVAALGLAGALLHTINHAFLKGLLFFGAGSVLHATGTGRIDRLGGLMKQMPKSGLLFGLGSAAICGLPPLNGFVGEFLVLVASLEGANVRTVGVAVPLLGAVAGLALVSGLAAAAFSKAFGIVYLGEPRSAAAASSHESGALMLHPQMVLAGFCVMAGLLAPVALLAIRPAVAVLAGDASSTVLNSTTEGVEVLWRMTLLACVFLAAAVGLARFRRRLLRGRPVARTVTWDCGYAAPTSRMSYTGSSYVQPLAEVFRTMHRTRKLLEMADEYFPRGGHLTTTSPDTVHLRVYTPLFRALVNGLGRFRKLQHGNLHLYILYVAVALLVLLIWKVG